GRRCLTRGGASPAATRCGAGSSPSPGAGPARRDDRRAARRGGRAREAFSRRSRAVAARAPAAAGARGGRRLATHRGRPHPGPGGGVGLRQVQDRKSTRLNSSHVAISYAVFCLKKKTKLTITSIFTQNVLFMVIKSIIS